MRIAGLLRAGAIVALVFVVIWLAVVLYWQAGDANPTAVDLGLYLLALPLAVLAGIWFLRWTVLRRRNARGAMPVATEVDETVSNGDSGPKPDRIVHLLASAVWLRPGASAAEVAAALQQPQRPPLHPQLRDAMGLPVFAAAVEDLEPASMEPGLRASMSDPDGFDRMFGEECLRALALLDPVAEELLYTALPPALDQTAESAGGKGLHPHAMHHSRSSRATAPAAPPAPLQVRLLLPSAWPAPARQVAGDWLAVKARAIGFGDEQFNVEVLAVGTAHAAWRLIDRIGRAQSSKAGHDRHLLLAAHSLIGQASIDRLDARRELLVSGHPEGLIPGEGAVGLLLGGVNAAVDSDAPPPRLHRLLHGRAGVGRGASRQAAELLRHALTTAAQPADAVAVVFSDADHRPSRAIEIAGAIATTLPELDPVDAARQLCLACGDIGAVAPLALLAAAAAQATQDDAAVLVFGLADPVARVALTVSPQPPVEVDRVANPASSAETATAVEATA